MRNREIKYDFDISNCKKRATSTVIYRIERGIRDRVSVCVSVREIKKEDWGFPGKRYKNRDERN